MTQKLTINGREMKLDVTQAIKDGTLVDVPKFPKAVMGNRYIRPRTKKEYIMASVGNFSIALISLVDGNRWNDPVKVEKLIDVSQSEAEKIFDQFFD
jgi:hypothetical protein